MVGLGCYVVIFSGGKGNPLSKTDAHDMLPKIMFLLHFPLLFSFVQLSGIECTVALFIVQHLHSYIWRYDVEKY